MAHCDDSVEEETEEMGKCAVGNAVYGPGAVVVHFRDTSTKCGIRQCI